MELGETEGTIIGEIPTTVYSDPPIENLIGETGNPGLIGNPPGGN